jgi:hypothetical protein
MKRTQSRFVVCVQNKGYSASLDLRKVYQALADKIAAELHKVRVIDESGEDYLYPQDFFIPVRLPQYAEKALLRATNGGR